LRQDQMTAGVLSAVNGVIGQAKPADGAAMEPSPAGQSPSAPAPASPSATSSIRPPPPTAAPQEASGASTALPTGVQTPAALPVIGQAVIQPGGKSLQLAPGEMYIYGMVTDGARPSDPFVTGQIAQVINGSNNLAAALAYGNNNQNQFTTATYNHAVGGVSVSGQWDSFDAYYGSNARPGASIVAASFPVKENSLVVIIGLAAGQTHVSLQGIPGLQVDGASSDGNGGMPMIIAHATLPPGSYVTSETSFGSPGQDATSRADLIGVFVFSTKQ
jgi:hypothetical protein